MLDVYTRAETLPILLSHIIKNYLAHLYCVCIIPDLLDSDWLVNIQFNCLNVEPTNNRCSLSFHHQQRNIDNNSSYHAISLVWMEFSEHENSTDNIVETCINSGCQAFVVSNQYVIRFMNSYSIAIYNAKHRFAQNHLIFLPQNEGNYNVAATSEIFTHHVTSDVHNFLLITQSELNGEDTSNDLMTSFDLKTSQFVGRFNIQISNAIQLDTFYGINNTFQQNANLFPDKLNNLEQRAVKLALFNYKPYAVWKEVPPGLGNANLIQSNEDKTLLIDGTETLMLLEFCQIFNCTLEISLDDDGEWGEIYDNGTGVGVIGALAERRADVGISALYAWYHEYLFLDFSMSISRTGITCLVPRARPLIGFFLTARPFSFNLWFGVIISYITGVFVLTIINEVKLNFGISKNLSGRKEDNIGDIMLKILAIYLQQSVNMGTWLPHMIIIVSITITGMVFGYVYGGGLASIMTVPQYETPIDTVHQLAASNMDWGATHDAWIFSILLGTQPDIITLVHNFRPLRADTLQKRTRTRDYSFSIERLPYGHFAIGEYITEESINNLQLMPNDIYYEYALAMYRKTWALQGKLDELILNVAQSGIQQYWELQVVYRYSDNKVQRGVSNSKSHHNEKGAPVTLKPTHLAGIFILWFMGLIISCMVFFGEILFARNKLKAK